MPLLLGSHPEFSISLSPHTINKKMKNIIITAALVLFAFYTFGQVSGNVNYQTKVVYSDNNINIGFPANADLFVLVKGLANVKADSYVAIFNVSQDGKTTEEVNSLIDTRINQALEQIKKLPGIETLVDMISFAPIYQFEVEKKIFSKKTYNEIPAGFEIKKNIHIKYTNPEHLNAIITILSVSEIYDLVRVDYFSNTIETVKKDLMTKSKVLMQEKIKTYESLLGADLDTLQKQLVDGYKVVFPVEMYKTYQAYTSSSLNLKKAANISHEEKTTTLYYQPIIDKEFDFVINPIIFEPVIQVMYEIKLKVNREIAQSPQAAKEYFFITPAGELKNLNIGK